MSKFIVRGVVTVSCWTEVEADSEQEALEIAGEREISGLCFMPFDAEVDEAFHLDSDGEPTELRAEAA